jgi:SAM-dependent methyltransferase
LDCRQCGASYPLIGRVPVLFRDATVVQGEQPEGETIAQLLRVFDLASDPVNVLRLRRMFRRQVQFGDSGIRVESAQFLDRVRDTGHEIASRAPNARTKEASDAPTVPRYRWLLDYIPRVLPCDTAITANVRFRNTGGTTLPHKPPNQIRLCAYWHDESGREVKAPDVRTPLPLDIPPGRELTLPIALHTPKTSGRLRLQLSMVQEGKRFLHDDAMYLPIRLDEGSRPILPEGWLCHDARHPDYKEDHNRGRELLAAWLGRFGGRRPRVLEIGGNAHPMAAHLGEIELYNLDVDLLGLQVASMIYHAQRHEIVCLCANAEDLPFPPGYFDAIVLFATLHHFPDPARLLGHIATRLRAGGFVGLFCEPVGHILPSKVEPEFLAELRKGVNEQSFTALEYDAIFRRARLRVEEAVIDFNSLKARLIPFD